MSCLNAPAPSGAYVCDEYTDLRWFSIGEMRLLTNIVDLDYPQLAQIAMTGKGT